MVKLSVFFATNADIFGAGVKNPNNKSYVGRKQNTEQLFRIKFLIYNTYRPFFVGKKLEIFTIIESPIKAAKPKK